MSSTLRFPLSAIVSAKVIVDLGLKFYWITNVTDLRRCEDMGRRKGEPSTKKESVVMSKNK